MDGKGHIATDSFQIPWNQEQRLRLLTEASRMLSASLDYEETLGKMAQLAVPLLADCCLIEQLEERGGTVLLRHLKVVHADPSKAPLAVGLQKLKISDAATHRWLHRLRQRQSILVPELPEGYLEQFAPSEQDLPLLRELAAVSVLFVPLIGKDKVLGAITLLSAHKERRYDSEDQLFAEELARLMSLVTDNLRLYRETQRAVFTRDETLRVVAHGLRNPINNIRLTAELIARKRDGSLEILKELARRIISDSERADSFIQDVHDLIQIEGGRLSLGKLSCHLGDLVQIAMRQARPRAESAAVALSHQIDDRVPFVQVDRARVLSACCKLLENAIQGTPRGGRVLCEVRWTGEHVLFSCHDSGPPMSEELIPHVFDGLWQPGPTELRGAGLALPMVKAVIEVHGGSVWAENRPGQGRSFHFSLPTPIPLDQSMTGGTSYQR